MAVRPVGGMLQVSKLETIIWANCIEVGRRKENGVENCAQRFSQ